VLRSAELDGSRYHQRVWTFQEYCVSRNLQAVDQVVHASGDRLDPVTAFREEGVAESSSPDLASTLISLPVSRVDGESDLVDALRAKYQRHMLRCSPLWIARGRAKTGLGTRYGGWIASVATRDGSRVSGSMSREEGLLDHVEDVQAAVALYSQLAEELHCLEETDKARALLPVLLNSPVESQRELVHLVSYLHHLFPENAAILSAFIAICQPHRLLQTSFT